MSIQESTNQREFIKLYNEVHKLLSEKFFGKTDKYVSFHRCIDEINKRQGNYFLSNHIDELRLINDFRNVIVHRTTNKFYDIAEPSDHIIAILTTIKTMLSNPIKISKFMDKKQVITFDINSDLLDVFDHVSKNHISQFPVFNQDKLVGMITDNGLAHFVASHIREQDFLNKNYTIKDVIQNGETDEYRNSYKILYSELELESVLNEFTDLNHDTHYILVTKSANNQIRSKADLLDIFTSSDIPEILQAIENNA